MRFEDFHRPLSRAGITPAVQWVLIVSTGLFVLQLFGLNALVVWLGLIPERVVSHYEVWRMVTYAFLHNGVFHWLFNMFMWWMFGSALESRWGTPFFTRFVTVCVIGSAICVILASPQSLSPAIGASGAIFGLLVAFAMVYPQAVMYLYFMIPVKAWQAAVLFGVIELAAATQGGGSLMTRLAHLGGMAFGFVYLKWRFPLESFIASPGRWLKDRSHSSRAKRPVLEEVTDDLVGEVDRLLDKVSKEGVEHLTAQEKAVLERYAKRRNGHI